MRRAELTGDADAPVVADHVAPLLRGEAAQHLADSIIGTPAGLAHGCRREDGDATLVEKTVEETLARQQRINKLMILDRGGERLRRAGR